MIIFLKSVYKGRNSAIAFRYTAAPQAAMKERRPFRAPLSFILCRISAAASRGNTTPPGYFLLRGRVKVAVVFPSALVMATVSPCLFIIALTMWSPSPSPSDFRD